MSETENMLSAYGSLLDVAATNNAAIRDNALEGAKLTRGRGAVYLAGQAGGMLMQNLASMAGMKTIGEERQETIESILDANRHLDPNDPKSLFTIGKQFSDVGFTGIAQKFLERGRKLDLDIYKADTDRISAMSSGSSYDPGTMRKQLNTAAFVLGCDLENDADCRKKSLSLATKWKRGNEWEKGSAKALVEEMTIISQVGAEAGPSLAKFEQMLNILPDIYTGWGGSAWNEILRVGAMFGLPAATKAAGQAEIFAQGGVSIALEYIKLTKGAISDREFETFLGMAPGLKRTELGNKLMLRTAKAYAEFNQKKAAEFTKWVNAQEDTPQMEDWSAHLIEWANREENII